jgi:hypothetical protein
MDVLLTILFYAYLGLTVSTPLLVIPAMLICRKLSNPWWKGLVVLMPLLGLPLFTLMLRLPKLCQRPAT